MSQVSNSTIAQPVGVRRIQRFGMLAFATTAITAIGVAGILSVTFPNSAPTVHALPAHQDIADGWMPGLAAAQAARLQRIADGWMPGLAAAQAARLQRIQDGWMPGLIATRNRTELTGGLMPGVNALLDAAGVTDGWESSLLP